MLISFEKMEAVRWAPYLKPEGIAVINDYEIAPLPVAIGKAEYPQNTIESMKACFDTRVLPGAELAEKAGNPRTMNVVLLGALIRAFGLTEVDWDQVLRENIPEKMLEVNLKALHLGMETAL